MFLATIYLSATSLHALRMGKQGPREQLSPVRGYNRFQCWTNPPGPPALIDCHVK